MHINRCTNNSYPIGLQKNRSVNSQSISTVLHTQFHSPTVKNNVFTRHKLQPLSHATKTTRFSGMFHLLRRKLRRLCSRLHRRNKTRTPIKKLWKPKPKTKPISKQAQTDSAAAGSDGSSTAPEKSIRVATFNAALFSMAPAVESFGYNTERIKTLRAKSMNDRPRSILKQSPSHPNLKSMLRVSINLPDNEISLLRDRKLSSGDDENRALRGKAPLRSSSLRFSMTSGVNGGRFRSTRTVLEVLRELDADVLALQDVKAEEEKAMKPLSDLAQALGMNYVFAESWAPEFGNAILSKWPIKRWEIQKIFDDTDFRNVLKATIDVPQRGEVNFHCTHLDHLDESWRMKQIGAIIRSSEGPHILAGGLNSLDEADYSTERWTDIVKYYEEMGKPAPKVEVMRFLKRKEYADAKDYAGECEAVVMIAKGQSVQGTCKYGTRVDYILASPDSPYKFVPGSYSVFSSKGTSDHHIVKVDLVKVKQDDATKKFAHEHKQKVVKVKRGSFRMRSVWKTRT